MNKGKHIQINKKEDEKEFTRNLRSEYQLQGP